MSSKVYKVVVEDENNNKKDLIEFAIGIIIYAIVLLLAEFIFKGIYVENLFYAIIAALILSMLNYFIKPFLIFLTLPLTIMSFGIAYPIVNVIILKICDFLMGNSFNMGGIINTFIIAIFISIMRIFLDNIVKSYFRR